MQFSHMSYIMCYITVGTLSDMLLKDSSGLNMAVLLGSYLYVILCVISQPVLCLTGCSRTAPARTWRFCWPTFVCYTLCYIMARALPDSPTQTWWLCWAGWLGGSVCYTMCYITVGTLPDRLLKYLPCPNMAVLLDSNLYVILCVMSQPERYLTDWLLKDSPDLNMAALSIILCVISQPVFCLTGCSRTARPEHDGSARGD